MRFMEDRGKSKRRAGLRARIVAVGSAAALALAAGTAVSDAAERYRGQLGLALSPERTTTISGVADVWCSDVRLGTAVARLSWSPEDGGEAVKAGGTPPAIRAEVTRYPLGFERNAFTVHEPGSQAMQSMQPASAQRGTASMSKMMVDAPPLPVADAEFVLLTDLEPGVNYTWRLAVRADEGWAPSVEAMTFQAPICPVDAEMGSEPAARHPQGGANR